MEKQREEFYCPQCRWRATEQEYERLKAPVEWDLKGFRRECAEWEKQQQVPLEPFSPPAPVSTPNHLTFSDMRAVCQSCEDTSGCELREFWLLASLLNDRKGFGRTHRAIQELVKQGFWLDTRRAKVYALLEESQLHGQFGDVVFIGERLKKERLASFFVDHWKYEPESPAGFWLGSLLRRLEKCHKTCEEQIAHAEREGVL